MQKKITFILIGLLIVFIGVYVGWTWYQKQEDTKQLTSKTFLPTFSREEITAVELTKAGITAVLTKQDDKWAIASQENAEADSSAIDQLLSMLEEINIQTTISRNLDNAASYDLDEVKRMIVVLKAGDKTVVEFYAGKTGAVPRTFYAVRPNDPQIYLINGSYYTLTKSDWKAPEKKEESNDENP